MNDVVDGVGEAISPEVVGSAYPCDGETCGNKFACVAFGLCGCTGGECSARSATDCGLSVGCTFAGQCTYGNGRCQAASEFDCDASFLGREWYLLREDGGHCVLPVGGCPSDRVLTEGRCVKRYGSEADCRTLCVPGSYGCAERPCADHGKCTWKGGTCVAASNDDCGQQSDLCAVLGRCAAQNGECVATDPKECLKSLGCKQQGLCTLFAGGCYRKSPADCAMGEWCVANQFNCGLVYKENYSGVACYQPGGCKVVHDGHCEKN